MSKEYTEILLPVSIDKFQLMKSTLQLMKSTLIFQTSSLSNLVLHRRRLVPTMRNFFKSKIVDIESCLEIKTS